MLNNGENCDNNNRGFVYRRDDPISVKTASNIILANAVFQDPANKSTNEESRLIQLLVIQALRFRRDWNKFLEFIMLDDQARKDFLKQFQNLKLIDEGTGVDEFKRKMSETYPLFKDFLDFNKSFLTGTDALTIFLMDGAASKLLEIDEMEPFRRSLEGVVPTAPPPPVYVTKRGNDLELSFNADNIELAYKKALSCIEGIEHSNIQRKEENVSIEANLGNKVIARLKGLAFCNKREFPIKVFVDFRQKKIEITDDSGFGIKWPATGKIIKNIREIAYLIKDAIEN